MTRNLQGWIITNGIGILWPDGRVDQLLLDRINDFFADPTDVVFSKDGQYLFVSGGGVQEVAMIDVSKMKKALNEAPDSDRTDILPNHLGIFRFLMKPLLRKNARVRDLHSYPQEYVDHMLCQGTVPSLLVQKSSR